MNAYGFVAVGIGAMLGAWLRWGLGLWLNAFHPAIPPGTLAANLIGGFLIGVAVAYCMAHPGIAPEWRLFVITGFLGGLTTFSTFSAESVSLLQNARYAEALVHSGVHLAGSVAATMVGFGLWQSVKP